jgi:hypothetical protein
MLAALDPLVEEVIEEIQSHCNLTSAEAGDLKVVYPPVPTHNLLASLQTLYSKHRVGKDRIIEPVDLWRGQLTTDPRLLKRVLSNLTLAKEKARIDIR